MAGEIRIWHPFDRKLYSDAWRESKFFGVIHQFRDDIKCACQRVRYGYCKYDLWNIDSWFLDIMPRMLAEHKLTRHGSPMLDGQDENSTHKAWDEVLDRMIFLFGEASEESCTRINPYEAEYMKIRDEFTEKYGMSGEKLMTDEERQRVAQGGGYRMHFVDELPEYQDTANKYMSEEKATASYREKCKDEAFALFVKHFYSLWD